MLTRRDAIALMALPLLPALPRAGFAAIGDAEAPVFAARVAAGQLPKMADRLPKQPRVIDLPAMGRRVGRLGGRLRTLISGQKDIRLMTVNGYARLIGYDEHLKLQADILESFVVEGDRVFTFKLREGHRWSDGHPVSSEDFRYTWEDVFLDKNLSAAGPDAALMVEGELPKFEILDDLTVRYSWKSPNPDFIAQIARAQPLSLMMPSHYLKQFHKKHQNGEKLEALIKKNRAKKWTDLHIKMARSYRPENPDLPTLDPWRNLTAPPSEQYIFERNPYFHQVDTAGNQLPYIDRFELLVGQSSIIAAKAGAGDSDLQVLGIDFADYTFLKDAEKRYPLKVRLWKRVQGSRIALMPNLNYKDPVWRAALRDVRVRRALSTAINRREINMAVFFGLGKESADTVLPQSPLFKEAYAKAWATHDPKLANELLDQAGYRERDDDGLRLLSDGRPMKIIVESAGESTLETDVLELVTDYWLRIGVGLFVRTSQRDVFRSRAVGGEIMMAIWSGVDNAIPTADMNPSLFVPSTEDQLQWPHWGLYVQSSGQQGSAPDMPEAVELVSLMRQWRVAGSTEERTALWERILTIGSENVFTIGTVNQTLQPIVAAKRLVNLPDEGLFGFDPTAYLGAYQMPTFWLDGEA
jgi:peptide/nickel transport system substrate-binding protein